MFTKVRILTLDRIVLCVNCQLLILNLPHSWGYLNNFACPRPLFVQKVAPDTTIPEEGNMALKSKKWQHCALASMPFRSRIGAEVEAGRKSRKILQIKLILFGLKDEKTA